MDFGTKIWVIGSPGSGKSSFSKQLGQHLGIIPTELDGFRFKAGWRECPRREARTKVRSVLESPSSILDGNFTYFGNDLLDLVDQIIWLDLPLGVSFGRVFKRSFGQLVSGETIHNGNQQTISSMAKILRKCVSKHCQLRAMMPDLLRGKNLLRLRSCESVKKAVDYFDASRLDIPYESTCFGPVPTWRA
jgi:adenylate kinase family enzyme